MKSKVFHVIFVKKKFKIIDSIEFIKNEFVILFSCVDIEFSYPKHFQRF